MSDVDLSAPPSDVPPRQWFTAHEVVALRPEITARTLRTWVENGHIPSTKRTTGRTSVLLFRITDVDDLLDAQVRPATAGPLAGRH